MVKSSVYPVPAKDRITINFGSTKTRYKIKIFSADMKVVEQDDVNGLPVKKEIDISHLPNGVYFISLTGDTTNEVLRFIKE
jgi:hypothetical protein